jgi:hypothetical protein
VSRIVVTTLAALALAACSRPPVTPGPDASDASPAPVLEGGALHTYRCPVGPDGGAWTCQDGLTTPVGTCAAYGCVP